MMTAEQKALARHALGLPNPALRSFRNRFAADQGSDDHGVWMSMVAAGHARVRKSVGMDAFWLTGQGAQAALEPREELDAEDFP